MSCQKKSNIYMIYGFEKYVFVSDCGFGGPGVSSVGAAADAGVAQGRAAGEQGRGGWHWRDRKGSLLLAGTETQ